MTLPNMEFLEWSNETCIALLQEYQKYPVLWNPKHSQYRLKYKKHEAWLAISDVFKIDVEEVKKKMNSLLGSFRRERSRVKNGAASTRQTPYVSKWFAYETMQFLSDRDESHDPLNITNDNVENVEVDVDANMESEDVKDILQTQLDEDNNLHLTHNLSDVQNKKHFLEEELFSNPICSTKEEKRHQATVDMRFEESKLSNNSTSTFIAQLDECTVYGQYVANKLRSYSPKSRAMVEHAINNILFDADMERLNQTPNNL